MTQAKMAECRASSTPRVRRHVEVLHCSRYVRVRFLHALEHKFIRPPSILYDDPAQCRCPPQSAASCNHLWGRGGVAGWPQSPSRCVVESSALARSSDKSFGGLKLREHIFYVSITRGEKW